MNLKELNSFKLSDAVTFHDKLNPKLWNGTKLRPEVREQLLKIAEDFLSELGVNDLDVNDITISGSNAAYSYTKYSDLDLHILVDMGNLPVDEVYRELFTAKKTIYNDTHDITIHKIPIELYVQDSRQPVVSLGEYSVMNDQWIRIPTKRRSDFDQTATKSKYEKLLSLIEIALQSKKYSKVKHIIDTIKRYRQAGLDKGGEFGPENLAYKMLRSQGYITKLYDLRDKLHSEKLSFETMYQNIDENEETNHWYDAGVRDATRGARPNPRTYLTTLKDKQAKHPEEVYFYMNGYKSVKKDVEENYTMQFASEKTPPVSPYAGVKDNQYRGGISEEVSPKYVTRVDMTPITDFMSGMKTYYGTDDWHESGLEKKDNFTQEMKGLYAGEPHRTALYASGNASKTRFLELNDPKTGQPVVYFDKKDIPRIRNTKTYVSVFDASRFKKLPTGEYFSENPGKPLKQEEITDPFKYMTNNGWVVRVTDDIQKEFKKAQQLHKAGKIDHYGGENLTEASGYIPSEKQKNDPRFKTALTVDVHPDSIKKNAKAFYWNTSRAGIPPTAKANGKI